MFDCPFGGWSPSTGLKDASEQASNQKPRMRQHFRRYLSPLSTVIRTIIGDGNGSYGMRFVPLSQSVRKDALSQGHLTLAITSTPPPFCGPRCSWPAQGCARANCARHPDEFVHTGYGLSIICMVKKYFGNV